MYENSNQNPHKQYIVTHAHYGSQMNKQRVSQDAHERPMGAEEEPRGFEAREAGGAEQKALLVGGGGGQRVQLGGNAELEAYHTQSQRKRGGAIKADEEARKGQGDDNSEQGNRGDKDQEAATNEPTSTEEGYLGKGTRRQCCRERRRCNPGQRVHGGCSPNAGRHFRVGQRQAGSSRHRKGSGNFQDNGKEAEGDTEDGGHKEEQERTKEPAEGGGTPPGEQPGDGAKRPRYQKAYMQLQTL